MFKDVPRRSGVRGFFNLQQKIHTLHHFFNFSIIQNMTAAQAKPLKGSSGVSRKKSSREQKIEALKYVKFQCTHKRHIVETFVNRTWGVGNFVPILVQYDVIKKVKDENYYEWLTSESIPTVIDSIWTVHGRTHNRPLVYHDMLPTNGGRHAHKTSPLVDVDALGQSTSHDHIFGIRDEVPPKTNAELITKYGGTLPVKENNKTIAASIITDALWDCNQYGIVEVGKYIAEKLHIAGYLK
jgi:hypothetical protein